MFIRHGLYISFFFCSLMSHFQIYFFLEKINVCVFPLFSIYCKMGEIQTLIFMDLEVAGPWIAKASNDHSELRSRDRMDELDASRYLARLVSSGATQCISCFIIRQGLDPIEMPRIAEMSFLSVSISIQSRSGQRGKSG